MLIPPAPLVPTVPRLQLCSFVMRSAFVGTSISITTRQSKLLCLGSSSKLFLRKSQGDSRVFVYITQSCIRQDSQYQQEEVLHWASHLEHPQSIGFDADRAPEKPDLNQFFQKDDGKEGWRGRMTKKDYDFSPYALVSLCTRLPTHSSPYFKKVMAGKDGEEG